MQRMAKHNVNRNLGANSSAVPCNKTAQMTQPMLQLNTIKLSVFAKEYHPVLQHEKIKQLLQTLK